MRRERINEREGSDGRRGSVQEADEEGVEERVNGSELNRTGAGGRRGHGHRRGETLHTRGAALALAAVVLGAWRWLLVGHRAVVRVLAGFARVRRVQGVLGTSGLNKGHAGENGRERQRHGERKSKPTGEYAVHATDDNRIVLKRTVRLGHRARPHVAGTCRSNGKDNGSQEVINERA